MIETDKTIAPCLVLLPAAYTQNDQYGYKDYYTGK